MKGCADSSDILSKLSCVELLGSIKLSHHHVAPVSVPVSLLADCKYSKSFLACPCSRYHAGYMLRTAVFLQKVKYFMDFSKSLWLCSALGWTVLDSNLHLLPKTTCILQKFYRNSKCNNRGCCCCCSHHNWQTMWLSWEIWIMSDSGLREPRLPSWGGRQATLEGGHTP